MRSAASRAWICWSLAFAAGSTIPGAAAAQLSLYNLTEAQAGSDPFNTSIPSNRPDVYEQLNLQYLYENVILGLRFEADHNSLETASKPGYQGVSLRWAEWSDDRVRVRAGNLYTMLGRGL